MAYQCYYSESGIRCPNRQEDYWCSPEHEKIWKDNNYQGNSKKNFISRLIDPEQAKQNLIRKGYMTLSPQSFERFILISRFEELKERKLIFQRNGNWFYGKDTWRETVRQLHDWANEDRESRQVKLV